MEKATRVVVLLLISSFLTEGLIVRKKIDFKKNTSSTEINSENDTRKGRFLNMLSLFTLVSFENTDCKTSSGTQGTFKSFKSQNHLILSVLSPLGQCNDV